MALAEAMCIDGGSNRWVNKIDDGFDQLRQDLVMMTMVDLVMMKNGSIGCYKKVLDAGRKHHCAKVSCKEC